MSLRIALVLFLSLTTACLIPPTRTSVAPIVDSGRDGSKTGQRFGLGVHSAGAFGPNPKLDVGVGLLAERIGPDAQPGAYLEIGRRLHKQGASRVWLAGRGEWLAAQGEANETRGLVTRLTYQLETTVSPDHFSIGSGVWGLEGFVEAGYRTTSDSQGSAIAMIGLSLRAPMFLTLPTRNNRRH